MKNKILLVFACFLIVMISAGCGKKGGEQELTGPVVKIGILEPLSGATSYYGEVQTAGIQLCADYINQKGGIAALNGTKIQLVKQDSAGDPETGVSAFELLVESGVSAIIGPYNSTVAAATAPLAIKYKIPYVIVNATSENYMSTPNKYVYRTNTGSSDGDYFQTNFVNYLNKLTKGRFDSVGIVYDSGDWGTAAVASWRNLSKTIGFKIKVDEAVTESTADMSTLVNKIKNAGCDLVVVAAFSNAANLLARQMKEYECNTKMIGLGGGFGDTKFIENLGPAAENILYTSMWLPSFGGASDEALEWNGKFKKIKGHDMTLESSWGWLGMGTLASAMEIAGSTEREAIADALYNIDLSRDSYALWFSIYDGVKFAVKGQKNAQFPKGVRYNNNMKLGASAGLVIVQVQNGKWKIVFPTTETGGKDLIVYP